MASTNYDNLYQASFNELIEGGCSPQLADVASDIVASGRERDSDDQALIEAALKYIDTSEK